jgi:hypothetical protein
LNYEEVPLGLEMEETNGNDITADALWMLWKKGKYKRN